MNYTIENNNLKLTVAEHGAEIKSLIRKYDNKYQLLKGLDGNKDQSYVLYNMTQDELAVMPGNKCILQLRGVRPFYSDKYDFTTHPRYGEVVSTDPANRFDRAAHVNVPKEHANQKRRMKEPFILYDIPMGKEE